MGQDRRVKGTSVAVKTTARVRDVSAGSGGEAGAGFFDAGGDPFFDEGGVELAAGTLAGKIEIVAEGMADADADGDPGLGGRAGGNGDVDRDLLDRFILETKFADEKVCAFLVLGPACFV